MFVECSRFGLWNGAVLSEECPCRPVLVDTWRILPEIFVLEIIIYLPILKFLAGYWDCSALTAKQKCCVV